MLPTGEMELFIDGASLNCLEIQGSRDGPEHCHALFALIQLKMAGAGGLQAGALGLAGAHSGRSYLTLAINFISINCVGSASRGVSSMVLAT